MTVYIVDYDLPEGSSRRRFYRSVRRYLADRNPGETTGWSTQSVVITEDKDFAEFVYDHASQLGHAHLYKGRKIK